jgi:hypothetical protein
MPPAPLPLRMPSRRPPPRESCSRRATTVRCLGQTCPSPLPCTRQDTVHVAFGQRPSRPRPALCSLAQNKHPAATHPPGTPPSCWCVRGCSRGSGCRPTGKSFVFVCSIASTFCKMAGRQVLQLMNRTLAFGYMIEKCRPSRGIKPPSKHHAPGVEGSRMIKNRAKKITNTGLRAGFSFIAVAHDLISNPIIYR